MMKKTIILLLVSIFVVSYVSAYEVNYTVDSSSSASVLQIVQLKYEPYPVNPGEYFDIWIKAQETGSNLPVDATFQLIPDYPFSLDSNSSAVLNFGQITNEPIVMKYRVRVDDNAVEGINQLKLRYNTDGRNLSWNIASFDIQVADAQTDFDLVVQESTGTDTAIAVANIGKNTANSLIVRIPQQDSFRISGTNGQMVGNLNAGDYSIVSFGLVPLDARNAQPLKVQLDYTDSIGKRRSVIKEVQFISNSPIGNLTGARYGNFSRNGTFRAGTSTTKSSSIFSSAWLWIIIVLLVGGFYVYKKPSKIKNFLSKLEKNQSINEKNSKETPDWVSSERKKKR